MCDPYLYGNSTSHSILKLLRDRTASREGKERNLMLKGLGPEMLMTSFGTKDFVEEISDGCPIERL